VKEIKKIIAKEFVWFIIAFFFSFPLALVPLTFVDYLITDYEQFLIRINNNIVILYFLLVLCLFLGVILIRVVSGAVKVLFDIKKT
jgi:hypothetical protein